MEEMVSAIQDVAEPGTEARSGTAQPDDAALETQLTHEISELWSSHMRLSVDRRATAKELRLVRARLAERLHEMKSLLSCPGRAGQWRSWLRQQHIPRSTADRLAARYAETLGRENNVLTGAIRPKEDSIEEMVTSLLPRLRRKLPDTQAVFLFIAAVGEAFGLRSYTCNDCTCVYLPGSEWDDPSEESTEDIDSEEAPSPDAIVS
jgi:hypothetical protein